MKLKTLLFATLVTSIAACTQNEMGSTESNATQVDSESKVPDTTHKIVVSIDDSILYKISAIEFLNKLKGGGEYWCNTAPKHWVKKSELPYLIKCLDSNNVLTGPVMNTLASLTFGTHGHTTLALEAYYIINGYRSGYYPPYTTTKLEATSNSVIGLPDSLKAETLAWWKSYNK